MERQRPYRVPEDEKSLNTCIQTIGLIFCTYLFVGWCYNMYRVLYKRGSWRYLGMAGFYCCALLVIIARIFYFRWSIEFYLIDERVTFWDNLSCNSMVCACLFLNMSLTELILAFKENDTDCKVLLVRMIHTVVAMSILAAYFIVYFTQFSHEKQH